MMIRLMVQEPRGHGDEIVLNSQSSCSIKHIISAAAINIDYDEIEWMKMIDVVSARMNMKILLLFTYMKCTM